MEPSPGTIQKNYKSNEELLEELNSIRSIEPLEELCNELILRGVYPPNGNYGYSVPQMVKAWGANWHIYQEPHFCPHCNTDLRDERGTPGKKEIGIVINDRVQYFACPTCRKNVK